MFKIQIITIGKTKESWLKEALQLYMDRLKGSIAIEFIIVKDDDKLQLLLSQHDNPILYLDPVGKSTTSELFSKELFSRLEKSGGRLSIVIGGPDGFRDNMQRIAISLSPMTFTHQMVRLILVEQIYRAWQIKCNTPYHKSSF